MNLLDLAITVSF